jgi:hypothetical protein
VTANVLAEKAIAKKAALVGKMAPTKKVPRKSAAVTPPVAPVATGAVSANVPPTTAQSYLIAKIGIFPPQADSLSVKTVTA